MPRLSISLPMNLYNRLSSLSVQHQESMSALINRLILAGMYQLENNQSNQGQKLEQHCQQLIIQINALIKNLSVELLHFNQDDFDKLQKACTQKYNELLMVCA